MYLQSSMNAHIWRTGLDPLRLFAFWFDNVLRSRPSLESSSLSAEIAATPEMLEDSQLDSDLANWNELVSPEHWPGSRKLRLFCASLCRGVWSRFPPEPRECVQIAEMLASGMKACEIANYGLVAKCAGLAIRPWREVGGRMALRAYVAASGCHFGESNARASVLGVINATNLMGLRSAVQANILREIAGDPFTDLLPTCKICRGRGRIVYRADVGVGLSEDEPKTHPCDQCKGTGTLRPDWLCDANVQSVAASIEAGSDFRDLPILADALEDAGCTSLDLLLHLRGKRVHLPGCWAVDLILGKE